MPSAEYQREWRKRNPEKQKMYSKTYYKNHYLDVLDSQRKCYRKYIEQNRQKRKDRIDPQREQYNRKAREYHRKFSDIRDNRNHFGRWTDWQDKMVIENKLNDIEIHNIIGRTLHAIQCRRNRLKERTHPIPIPIIPRIGAF